MHLMNIDAEGFVGRVGGGGNVRSTLVYTHTTIWPREVVMAENIANQKRALGFCECGRWKAVNKNRHYRRESEIRQHLDIGSDKWMIRRSQRSIGKTLSKLSTRVWVLTRVSC